MRGMSQSNGPTSAKRCGQRRRWRRVPAPNVAVTHMGWQAGAGLGIPPPRGPQKTPPRML